MSFKKDRAYQRRQKTQKALLNVVKANAKQNLIDKFRLLDDEKTYDLKDLGFKTSLMIKGKDIKRTLS